jgi:hypothetical protein
VGASAGPSRGQLAPCQLDYRGVTGDERISFTGLAEFEMRADCEHGKRRRETLAEMRGKESSAGVVVPRA